MQTIILRPNEDIKVDEWQVTGEVEHYNAIDQPITDPEEPDWSKYIAATADSQIEILGIENAAITGTIKKIEFKLFGDFYSSEATSVALMSESNDIVVISEDIPFVEADTWVTITADNLNLTVEQLNSLIITLLSPSTGTLGATINAIYLIVTYEEPANAEPLSKKPKNLPGYNYFIKHYMRRKKLELTPYKLPDGTLF
jgi:hypothetical protein